MKNLEALETKSVIIEATTVENKGLETYLDELQDTTKKIISLSGRIVIMTFVGFFISVPAFYFQFSFKFTPSSSGFYLLAWTSMLGLIIAAGTFFYLVSYEIFSKKGNALFSEISDEIEWNLKTGKSGFETPKIDARVILRSFVMASELPFFRGKYGTGIYLIINLVSLAFSVANVFNFSLR
jgi:hypothetical protein